MAKAKAARSAGRIRDRIKGLRRVKASSLLTHPKNWRRHGEEQTAALRGVLEETGFADALLVRETPEGLQLIDGHLRQGVAGDATVPVLVLDVTEQEAEKLLATLDPLAAMAEADEAVLKQLVEGLEVESQALEAMLEGLMAELEDVAGEMEIEEDVQFKAKKGKHAELDEAFQVLVVLPNELEQKKLFDRLTKEGFSCRVLTL